MTSHHACLNDEIISSRGEEYSLLEPCKILTVSPKTVPTCGLNLRGVLVLGFLCGAMLQKGKKNETLMLGPRLV